MEALSFEGYFFNSLGAVEDFVGRAVRAVHSFVHTMRRLCLSARDGVQG